jgi:hypothetical protein
MHDEWPATGLAAMIVFARMEMAIFLELRGCTGWTRFSCNHSFLPTSWYQLAVLTNHTMGLSAEHYLYNTTKLFICHYNLMRAAA